MNFICFNGKMLPAQEPVLMVDNRGYRYGDGLFETMKLVYKKITLEQYHFERFFFSLEIMGFKIPALLTAGKLKKEILLLCDRNNCDTLARVRLSVFRGNGGVFESLDDLQYIIECWPLNESVNQLNENGLVIDLFPDGCKSFDKFSGIKSANYLPYAMAARYAKVHQLNECLVLNGHKRIADATIANVFIIKGETVITPPLSEAGVNGVMRRHLIEKISVEEKPVSAVDLKNADEVFLTNVISGIRWVQRFQDRQYDNQLVKKIYKEFIQTISA